MKVEECIKERRSIRQFADTPVADDLLAQIVEEASYAPSWKNTQIVRYIAVEGLLKDKIADECTSAYGRNGEIIKNAPVLIALTFIKNRSGFERDGSYSTAKKGGWQMFDAGIAAQTFCLSAHAHELGTVIMGIFDEAKASSLLELPENQELCALIPLGYPAEEPMAPKRKSVDELLTFKL